MSNASPPVNQSASHEVDIINKHSGTKRQCVPNRVNSSVFQSVTLVGVLGNAICFLPLKLKL